MKYRVTYMPAESNIKGKIVSSLAKAEEYIKTKICKSCKEDLENGYIEFGDKYTSEKMDIKKASETLCGAEFWIEEIK